MNGIVIGRAVPFEDSEALCAAVMRLVESAELRASLGLAAREYAVKYLDKERVLRRFELDMLAVLIPPEDAGAARLARGLSETSSP